MANPLRKQSIPISSLPIAILVLILVASTIAVLTFALSKMQAPKEAQETKIDTNLATTCQNACRDCSSKEYDVRCFDRCRFGFKPYCD
jgi:hypothetical protein